MRKNKGFTLIELMIVIAIIAIIAAIAIPNLMQSRMRANETTAVTQVKNYANAQLIFVAGQQGRGTVNSTNGGPRGFCDNFRNLYYGNPITTRATADTSNVDPAVNLLLINEAHANAFTTSAGTGAATNAAPLSPGNFAAFNGYAFTEPGDIPVTAWATGYGHVAGPIDGTRTGTSAFFIGTEGNVMRRGLLGTFAIAGSADVNLSGLLTSFSTGGGDWVTN